MSEIKFSSKINFMGFNETELMTMIEFYSEQGYTPLIHKLANLQSENKRLREVLKLQINYWENLACGYEDNPNPNNTSPEDTTAWTAGIARQQIIKALAEKI